MAMKTISPLLQKLLIIAQEEGRKCGSVELLPEHVLLAMIKSSEGLGFITLKELNLNILPLQVMIEKNFSVNPGRDTQISELPPSIRLRALIDVAAMEANALRNEYVGSEHILIASSREEDSTSHKFFSRAGISSEDIRNAVRTVQSHFTSSYFFAKQANKNPKFSQAGQAGQGPMIPAQGPFERRRQNASFLAEYSRDLTALSREGKLDPVVGREKELKRLVQILSRRTKNNPVLVGEPGVGKTAVVEALAQKIAQGQVPYYLLKKRILSLDLAALVAGTKYRGEFEDRMKRMMKEIREDGNIIIFIDELHTIIGAGGPEGAMDASNILKPALSRGEIQIVGATTL
ncbi:MAG TPA: Clp protease, partial [Treponema sp.]|nr:Clp protease [Treponema sp.]